MKRQRSRNRGGGGGGKPQHNANRAFESNGPDGVKIRGAAQHVFEKYQQLARDALTAGDRVLAESYQQHAEHYFRVLRAVQPQRLVGEIMNRDAFASGFDIDFEDEDGAEIVNQGEPAEVEAERGNGGGEWRQDNRYEGRRDDRQRDDRPRDERPRDERPRDERPRDDRQRSDSQRSDYQRSDNPRSDSQRSDSQQRSDNQRPDNQRPDNQRSDSQRDDRQRYRDDRPRNDRNERFRDDRPSDDRRYERTADPLAVVEPQATPLTSDADQAGSPILRSQDGGISQAPAFLQARSEPRPETTDEGEARPKPRRRRSPRGLEGDASGEPSSPAGVTEDA